MSKKNTDTVKAMLTPGEFVIKKKSAKKIGYDKLNQMNKTGNINSKEAKMPQGKGTYGSKVGRPPKKAEGYKKGGKVKKQTAAWDLKHEKQNTRKAVSLAKKVKSGEITKSQMSKMYSDWVDTMDKIRRGKGGGASGENAPKQRSEKETQMQFGGRVLGHDDVEFDEDKVGGLSIPSTGPVRGYSKGGKVSGGYAIHGASDKYKVGE